MIAFITWLRCLAALLITNAHYTGIYPVDIIANGGLIGDILFFAVSGYCLTNIRTGFFRWYGKRISRIIPAVILITVVYFVLGQYDALVYASGTENTILYQVLSWAGIEYPLWLSWFIYPTYYHFVGSIIVLYIPYYFVMKMEWLHRHLPQVMVALLVIYVAVFALVYDKSYYHIDTVREPMIRFLFMESMLLGGWFRLNDERCRNRGKKQAYLFGTGALFLVYFASKLFFARGWMVQFQIANQVIIFSLLVFLFLFFASVDKYLEGVPQWLKCVVSLIADITLEVYLVQYVLIDVIREMGLAFPINWLLLTALIVVAAYLLHKIVALGTAGVTGIISRER